MKTSSLSADHLLQGLALSPGLAEGRAVIYQDISQRTSFYDITHDQIDGEWDRLQSAIDSVEHDLERVAKRVEDEMDRRIAAIFQTHIQLLGDPNLQRDLRTTMCDRLVNAETVVQEVFHVWAQRLEQNGPMGADDLLDLSRRVLRSLHGLTAHQLEDLPEASVVVAERLLPSDTLFLSRTAAVAVVLAQGGWASHAAMLTRERGLPSVGSIKGATARISSGARSVVDGYQGIVVMEPDQATLDEVHNQKEQIGSERLRAWNQRRDPCRTRSDEEVTVFANVHSREETKQALDAGAEGIGLYRIEQLYLARRQLPDTDSLLELLYHDLEPAQDRQVVLRLLDAGVDKLPQGMALPPGTEGPLGLRGVRILLRYPDLLHTQLEAGLRLSQRIADLRLLIPMVTFSWEIEQIRDHLDRLSDETGIAAPPLGAMIETPAAALEIEAISAASDFLSIGSNDLTQYTLAADRDAAQLHDYYRPRHPAVLQLIARVVEQVGAESVSLCGEMAGDTDSLHQLLDLGLRVISVAPPVIPDIKKAIRSHA